jgi:4-amino-4-deoxy-L-arabinose transferase-like glycosyltransferase
LNTAPARPVTLPRWAAPLRWAVLTRWAALGRGGDAVAVLALGACFAALSALTWRRWGMPEIDAGAELTTADLVKHGALAYRDVRYYYGPLGLYSLAFAFTLLGSSFTTAFAFGLAQAAAIVGLFYALARQWLAPPVAALSAAVLLAIGFSGTAFDFVLPHTDSATFGLACLLAMLLALARGRLLGAGVAAGLVGLTRPEFEAVALGALAAYALVAWRIEGRAAARRAIPRLALPALAIPALVLGWFATRAGLSTLVSENLWPVRFIHVGARTERAWMPFTIASFVGLAARAAIYLGLLWALVRSVELWRARAERAVDVLWPPAFAGLVLVGADGALRATGLLAGERHAIELELHHLTLGMSWLPALGFAAAAFAAVRLIRRGDPPLGGASPLRGAPSLRGRWPADAALIVAAAGLGLRAYGAFTTEGSYAPYYAAPLVLLLGVLHARVAERRPRARPAALGALGLVAAGLAAYALGGLYAHEDTPVHTPRGTFLTSAVAAGALEGAVAQIDRLTRPGQPILAAPVDGGLYFMADRPPALYELSLLPGLLASAGEEAAAVARLRREHVRLAVIGARDFAAWGTPTFGVDYAWRLGAYLRGAARSREVIGTLADPAGGTYPSKGFTVLGLK